MKDQHARLVRQIEELRRRSHKARARGLPFQDLDAEVSRLEKELFPDASASPERGEERRNHDRDN